MVPYLSDHPSCFSTYSIHIAYRTNYINFSTITNNHQPFVFAVCETLLADDHHYKRDVPVFPNGCLIYHTDASNLFIHIHFQANFSLYSASRDYKINCCATRCVVCIPFFHATPFSIGCIDCTPPTHGSQRRPFQV